MARLHGIAFAVMAVDARAIADVATRIRER